ncbi:MAG: hypothetical protein IPM35_19445 [Myxococcales bacterium]|nr:hypothetical protein [Myxococcales bacterium]
MSGGVLVPGLDASTPLGFLAALGLLRVLDESATNDATAAPRLAFREVGRWRPVFHGVESLETLVGRVHADSEAWGGSPVLGFRYVKVQKKGPARFGGLTPPLGVLRGWMLARLFAEDQRALEYVAALIAETATQAVDDEDLASPEQVRAEGIDVDSAAPAGRSCLQTAFDFSSRNMQFLDQIDCVREAILESPNWIEGELVHNEPVSDWERTMGWDTLAKAPGAQYPRRATANRPATEWLAFRGLVFLPVFGRGKNVQTTACRGRRLNGEFIWPLWVQFATAHTIRSLLAYPELENSKPNALRALGVAQVFRARLTKLGKYDAIFTPTEPVGGAVLQSPAAAMPPVLPNPAATAPRPQTRSPERAVPRERPAPRDTSSEVEPDRVDWMFSDDD